MDNLLNVRIAGRELRAAAGQTILELAQASDIYIPTLCHFAGLSDIGACRLCVVEIRGVARLAAACVTCVGEGMEVTVDSPRLAEYRRMIVELLLAERNHVCAVCVANGACELQALAQRLGVTHARYPYRYPRFAVDASHPRFIHDANRCVLCTRCVRVCTEVEGARTWAVMQRGSASRLGADLDQRWGETQSCTSCGKCVRVCPTGALVDKGHAVGERPPHDNVLPDLLRLRASAR